MSSVTSFSKISPIGEFMRPNPPTFMGSNIEKDPQELFDDTEKIFRVMHIGDIVRVEFVSY